MQGCQQKRQVCLFWLGWVCLILYQLIGHLISKFHFLVRFRIFFFQKCIARISFYNENVLLEIFSNLFFVVHVLNPVWVFTILPIAEILTGPTNLSQGGHRNNSNYEVVPCPTKPPD